MNKSETVLTLDHSYQVFVEISLVVHEKKNTTGAGIIFEKALYYVEGKSHSEFG